MKIESNIFSLEHLSFFKKTKFIKIEEINNSFFLKKVTSNNETYFPISFSSKEEALLVKRFYQDDEFKTIFASAGFFSYYAFLNNDYTVSFCLHINNKKVKFPIFLPVILHSPTDVLDVLRALPFCSTICYDISITNLKKQTFDSLFS